MHSPESLNNNSAKENEERREEQGQQWHHFSPEGKICKQKSGPRVARFPLEFQFPSTSSKTMHFPQKLGLFPGVLKTIKLLSTVLLPPKRMRTKMDPF